ncbi:MAG TPA: TetR/AcrR family transcriptional regulator [Mycobacterium sp.]|nr:TetR/AcrR family transcriptional regulator [Mycobacterium sp.]
MTTVSQSRPARGRRTARPSGDDREQAILATAERLLEERPFTEISVDDLAKGAGISRPTFYFYFASKDAVLLALFEQVITEADSVFERHAQNPPTDRYDAWRSGINVFFETFVKHKGVTRAAHEVRASNSAVRDLLATYMAKWIDSTAATIEAERTQGAVPTTLPAHDLATALNLMNERALFASFTEERPSIPKEQLLDTLVYIWVTSIYGRTD